MDPSQFDTVLCAFTLTRSRRGLGSALAGLVLGGALGSVALEAVAAKKKKKKRKKRKKKCPNGSRDCDGKCTPRTECCKGFKDCGGECIPNDQCCHSDPIPLCNGCQELQCAAGYGEWMCAIKKGGQACGPLCCEYGGCGSDGTDYRCCCDKNGCGPYCTGFQHCCNPGWTCDGKTCKPPA